MEITKVNKIRIKFPALSEREIVVAEAEQTGEQVVIKYHYDRDGETRTEITDIQQLRFYKLIMRELNIWEDDRTSPGM